jgi:hypothetical protein
MTLFGLSPWFLTTIASAYFTDDSGHFNAMKYMLFLAALTVFVHLVGTFALNGPTTNIPQSNSVDEHSPLISGESESSVVQGSMPERHIPLKDPSFWFLGLLCFCTLGSVSNYVLKVPR